MQNFQAFSKIYSFPGYVKQAGQRDVFGDDDLLLSQYADPVNRGFPIHTKAATYVSYLYFLENQLELPEKHATAVKDRLDQSARFWGISGELATAQAKYADRHRTLEDQLPDSKFAYVWLDEEGNKERRYPLRNAEETLKAASWLRQHRDHWSYDDRRTMANKVIKQAAIYGVTIPDADRRFLERQAGFGIGNRSRIVSMLRNRVKRAEIQPAMQAALDNLADAVSKSELVTQNTAMMCKVASVVDSFDRECHLTHNYCDSFPRPEDVVFEHTMTDMQKTAASVCELTTGSIFPASQLEVLRPAQIRDLFGSDAAEAVVSGFHVNGVKLAEFAANLPEPEAELLEMALLDHGIEPAVKKVASARVGFDPQELADLAKGYSG